MPHTYEYPRPALTVDCVVFGLDEGDLKVMLIKRGEAPFKGRWALPGGYVRMDESLEEAARRELAEETGLTGVFLEQLYTFGEPGRDPRGRTVSVAYYALVNLEGREVKASADAEEAAWFSVNDVPKLAFDHDGILSTAITRLRGKVRYVPVGFELLPEHFTLTQLQHVYEAVLDREFDKRNFRKKVLALGILKDTGEIQQDVAHRAARLFKFDEAAYKRLITKGINFEV
jgi:8-oxo-dGTP diphosphatase